MALWVRDFRPAVPVADLIHKERYATALALVRAGYEDLIAMRDALSPVTHLVLHAYDFAIPDGRGVCHLGPWLKPTFDLRGFPAGSVIRFEVVKTMLQQFAAMLKTIEQKHHDVTFLNAQGTLVSGTPRHGTTNCTRRATASKSSPPCSTRNLSNSSPAVSCETLAFRSDLDFSAVGEMLGGSVTLVDIGDIGRLWHFCWQSPRERLFA